MGAKSAPETCKWGQKAPRTNQSRKSVGAKSAVKMQKWGQKAPQNSKVTAKSATTQISVKKVMVAESAIKMEKRWRTNATKQQSDGKKRHHF